MSPAPPAASSTASGSNDLTAQLLPHLDRQLVLPLLDFLESRGTYSHEEVLKAKYDLLKPTNMVTFVLGLQRELEGKPDSEGVPEGQLSARVHFARFKAVARHLRGPRACLHVEC